MIYRKSYTPSLEEPGYRKKGFEGMASFEKVFENEDKTGISDKTKYVFVGSSEVVDRDGDVVKLDGIDYTNFKSNPVVLWAHDASSLPIGKVVGIKRDVANKKEYFEIVFGNTSFAKDVESLVASGMIKATSIGFMIKDWDYNEKLDAFEFTETEMLEISLCTIPANQEAVMDEEVKSTSSKSLSAEDIHSIAEAVRAIMDEEKKSNPEKDEDEVVDLEPEAPESPIEPHSEPEGDESMPDIASLLQGLTEQITLLVNTAEKPEEPAEPVEELEEVEPIEAVEEVVEPASEEEAPADEEDKADRSEEAQSEPEVVEDLTELTEDDELIILT